VVGDWSRGVEAARNVVLVSVPSLLDPSLAPAGKHILHAYVPATEDYDDWRGLDRAGPEYAKKKAAAADFLWQAVEKYIPDARSRSDVRVEQVGTPLTHERFLRRERGSYGPRIPAGSGASLPSLPAHKTPLKGLWLCGDYSFPGVGVPAAAASGAVTANSILSLPAHMALLKKAGL
jgi:phytoene dehydrogenase-like protein